MSPSFQLEIANIVEISTAREFKSEACADTRRLGACNLMNTGLMRSVKALIPAIMIYHQLRGAVAMGFEAVLMYSNNAMHFSNSPLQTFPMQSQRIVNCGQVYFIWLINLCCSRKY